MPKPTTHVLIVTDVSGSMHALAADVRGGFNSYIGDLVAAKQTDDSRRYRITATLFNTNVSHLCVAAKLRDVPHLNDGNYLPAGGTALLDAVGQTLIAFDEDVTLGEDDRVLLVIQTDGEENSSQMFSGESGWARIRRMLDERDATGRWSVVYLGTGIEAWSHGAKFGGSTQVLRSHATSYGVAHTYTGLAAATVEYSRGAAPTTVSAFLANEAGPEAIIPMPSAPQTPGTQTAAGHTRGHGMTNEQPISAPVDDDAAAGAEAAAEAIEEATATPEEGGAEAA